MFHRKNQQIMFQNGILNPSYSYRAMFLKMISENLRHLLFSFCPMFSASYQFCFDECNIRKPNDKRFLRNKEPPLFSSCITFRSLHVTSEWFESIICSAFHSHSQRPFMERYRIGACAFPQSIRWIFRSLYSF